MLVHSVQTTRYYQTNRYCQNNNIKEKPVNFTHHYKPQTIKFHTADFIKDADNSYISYLPIEKIERAKNKIKKANEMNINQLTKYGPDKIDEYLSKLIDYITGEKHIFNTKIHTDTDGKKYLCLEEVDVRNPVLGTTISPEMYKHMEKNIGRTYFASNKKIDNYWWVHKEKGHSYWVYIHHPGESKKLVLSFDER